MKKYLNISLIYAILAMVGGVFYREFTKLNGYTGVTALGKVHTHLFLLGIVMFLIITVFYTGLGCALALAGVQFWIMFFNFNNDKNNED